MVAIILFLFSSLNLQSSSDSYDGVNFDHSDLRIIDSSFSQDNGDIYLYVQLNNGDLNVVIIKRSGEVESIDVGFLPDRHISRMVYLRGQQSLRFWDSAVGRVYDFNLLDLSWKRIDTSHNHKNQSSHAAYVDSSGTIFAMGGYGYWELKNIFSYFNRDDGQWYEMSALNRDLVPRAMGGYLFKGGGSFYYSIEKKQQRGSSYAVYEYDISTNIWTQNQKKSYLAKDFGLVRRQSYDQDLSNSIDQNRNRVALISEKNNKRRINILDYIEDRIYTIDPEDFGLRHVRMVYYYEEEDKWVVIGNSVNINVPHMLIARTLYLQDSLEKYPMTIARFWLVYPFMTIASFSILLIILFYPLYLNKKEVKKWILKEKVTDKPIKIFINRGKPMQVVVANKKVDLLSDPITLKFWEIILEMEQNGGSMLMHELDEKLFGSSMDAPGRHRMRSRLFDTIHKKINNPLIIEKSSDYDKRVKVLQINSDLIEIVN
jgi:hypothetical protein